MNDNPVAEQPKASSLKICRLVYNEKFDNGELFQCDNCKILLCNECENLTVCEIKFTQLETRKKIL